MYEIDLKRNPCECGHGSAYHYGGDEDEFTDSGIMLRRSTRQTGRP
jgi:hypothetical protein